MRRLKNMTPGCFGDHVSAVDLISQQFPCKCGKITFQHTQKKPLPASGLAWELQGFQPPVSFPCKQCSFSKHFHHRARRKEAYSPERSTHTDTRLTAARRQQAFNGGQRKLDVDEWRLKIEPWSDNGLKFMIINTRRSGHSSEWMRSGNADARTLLYIKCN